MVISDEKYVLLTTFRKSGDAVSSPVWIAPLPDGSAGFTTEPDVGKVKRIRHTSRVTLQPCSVGGKVKDGSEAVEATAKVLDGADAGPIHKAIRRKYWALAPLLGVPAFFGRLFGRKPTDDCAIHLTFGQVREILSKFYGVSVRVHYEADGTAILIHNRRTRA